MTAVALLQSPSSPSYLAHFSSFFSFHIFCCPAGIEWVSEVVALRSGCASLPRGNREFLYKNKSHSTDRFLGDPLPPPILPPHHSSTNQNAQRLQGHYQHGLAAYATQFCIEPCVLWYLVRTRVDNGAGSSGSFFGGP